MTVISIIVGSTREGALPGGASAMRCGAPWRCWAGVAFRHGEPAPMLASLVTRSRL